MSQRTRREVARRRRRFRVSASGKKKFRFSAGQPNSVFPMFGGGDDDDFDRDDAPDAAP